MDKHSGGGMNARQAIDEELLDVRARLLRLLGMPFEESRILTCQATDSLECAVDTIDRLLEWDEA